MKKLLLLSIVAVLGMNASAQVVISNDFGTPVGSADDLNSNVNWSWNDNYHRGSNGSFSVGGDDYDYDDPFFYAGASWYLDKSVNAFGVNGGYTGWNQLGGEVNIATDETFDDNWDFGVAVNYSFGLWKTGSSMGVLIFAIGPSYHMYKQGTGTEGQADLIVDPRLSVRVNHILITAGYQQRFGKFHLTKEYTADPMFHLGIAYCF